MESDAIKKAQVQAIRPVLAQKYQEAEALEGRSRRAHELLEAELKEREAYFAQSEILSFVHSKRRRFTPLNVARAMAGLPRVMARVSCDVCTKHGINPPPGIGFHIFQTIKRMVPEPIRDLRRSIDRMQDRLLNQPLKTLPHGAQLRKNWYFLESAIRIAARETRAPRGSLPFRIFAEYSRTSTSHNAVEAVLADANRLLIEGEDPELEHGVVWGSSHGGRTKRVSVPKR